VATTAEGSGLLGSEAYTQDPLVPLEQTAAVINLDVTNVRGATRDIDALGVDRSTLGRGIRCGSPRRIAAVGSRARRARLVNRSDHFPFSKAGVPALSIEPGRDFVGRPAGWGEQEAARYNRERYHQPGDGTLARWRVAAACEQPAAMSRPMPRWLRCDISEFQRPGRRARIPECKQIATYHVSGS